MYSGLCADAHAHTQHTHDLHTVKMLMCVMCVCVCVSPQALDRDRLALTAERRALNDERVASSQAAQTARAAQMQLAEAVRQWVTQGVPIPFHVEGRCGAHTHTLTLTILCDSPPC